MSSGRKKRLLFMVIGLFTWPFGLHFVYAGLWKMFFWLTIVPWILFGVGYELDNGYLEVAGIFLFFLSIMESLFGNVDGHGREMD